MRLSAGRSRFIVKKLKIEKFTYGDDIEKKWAQKLHDASGLEGLDVLWTRGKLGHGLDELGPRFLILLENLKEK